MDNINDFGFHITYQGNYYYFAPFTNGLYYYDTRTEPKRVDTNTNNNVSPYSLLQTIDYNKRLYTAREIKGEEDTHHQQEDL